MRFLIIIIFAVIAISCGNKRSTTLPNGKELKEVNANEIPVGGHVYAIIGATLIDGTGAEPVANACVVIRDEKIEAVGKEGDVRIPDDAEIININGMTILPGLIDAHYHDEDSDTLSSLYLGNGVTSVRDPGEWIESYAKLRASGKILPRLFLAGPHLDHYPPAYPEDSWIVRDPEEARLAVKTLAAQGATVIKVYYGLPLETIREVCRVASENGLPVTAHLETTNARDAINAGLDGIEHITSFGSCLLPMREVETYKQKVTADKNARRRGRYEVWNSLTIDDNPDVDSLVNFLAHKKTFISPTLAVFERRSDRGDSVEVRGFGNMIRFVGRANAAGARIVVGSHSYVPYAELGFAYQREMELLHEAGLTNMEVLHAATLQNARFLRIDEKLGSIEVGKLADLVMVEGDPLGNMSAMRNVRKVMLNGVWVRK